MHKDYEMKAKKKNDEDEITTRILRFVEKPIAKVLVNYTEVTPNQITYLSFLIAMVGAYYLFQGGYVNQLIGGICAMGYIIFDGVDGEIARRRNLESKKGMWLDGIVGFFVNPFLIIALSIGIGTKLSLILGMFAAVCYPMQYMYIYFHKFEIVETKAKMDVPIKGKFSILRFAYGSVVFFPILFFGVLINQAILILWFYATLGNLFWMAIVFLQYKGFRGDENE